MSTEVDAVQKARKDRKAKRKREQTAVVGDMSGMLDTLPTLELLMKQSSAASEARYAECFLFSTHFCVFSIFLYIFLCVTILIWIWSECCPRQDYAHCAP